MKDTVNINQRWRDHFQELLNRDSSVDESVFDKIPQLPVNAELGAEPTLGETKSSIKEMKNGKAPGVDGIPAEIFKHGGDDLALCQTEETTPFVRVKCICVLLNIYKYFFQFIVYTLDILLYNYAMTFHFFISTLDEENHLA